MRLNLSKIFWKNRRIQKDYFSLKLKVTPKVMLKSQASIQSEYFIFYTDSKNKVILLQLLKTFILVQPFILSFIRKMYLLWQKINQKSRSKWACSVKSAQNKNFKLLNFQQLYFNNLNKSNQNG